MLAAALSVHAQSISLTLDTIHHPAFDAEGIRVDINPFDHGVGDVFIKRLRSSSTEVRDLHLHCAGFRISDKHIECPQGLLRSGKQPPIKLSFSYAIASRALNFTLRDVDLAHLQTLGSGILPYGATGRADLTLVSGSNHADLGLVLRGVAFSSPDGNRAGEGISAQLTAVANRKGNSWSWQARLEWPQGELYWAPWYRKAGVRGEASGTLNDRTLDISLFRLTLNKVGSVTAALNWDRLLGKPLRWGFVTDEIDLSTAVDEWVQPWLDQSAIPKLHASGHTRLSGEWADGRLQSFFVGLENATLADGNGYLEFSAINASVPWLWNEDTHAEIAVGAGRWGELPLGGFSIPATLHGDDVRLQDVSIPLLDGRLYVDRFHATRPEDGWRWNFSGGIETVSLPKISTALKIPPLSGTLTARVPDATYGQHIISLGGAMVIDVFDGRITARNLQVIEPMSRRQRFLADVEMRRLDLGMLTRTFSFGSITGRLDGEVKSLELQGWKPLSFDARFASSPGDYPRTISRGALQDISAIGGAAGAAAVKASPVSFFNTFGYDRIGIGCKLKDKVCTLDGIEPDGKGYVLVKGSGIPAVKVIGYNRSIDWDLLVSRIQAVIAGKSKAVIE